MLSVRAHHPLLFVTQHGNHQPGNAANAIARFRLAGGSGGLSSKRLPSLLLAPALTSSAAPEMPRGLAILSYDPSSPHTDTLLVAYAAAEGFKGVLLAVYAHEAAAAGKHGAWTADADAVPLHATLFASKNTHHPYGIATHGTAGSPLSDLSPAVVFVSNQGDGRIVPLDAGIHLLNPTSNAAFEGYIPWPAPEECCKVNSSGTTGVRGIALSWDGTMTSVACRDGDCVSIYGAEHRLRRGAEQGDSVDGGLMWTLRDASIRAPIALVWGTSGDGMGLFVSGEAPPSAFPGLSDEERRQIVFVSFFNFGTGRVTQTFAHADGGGHAAGMARVGGSLLVIGQEKGAVYEFDAASGAFLGTVVEGLVRPEALCVWGGEQRA